MSFMDFITIWRAIGVPITLQSVTPRAIEYVKEQTDWELIPNGDKIFPYLLFLSVVVAAFFWPIELWRKLRRRRK